MKTVQISDLYGQGSGTLAADLRPLSLLRPPLQLSLGLGLVVAGPEGPGLVWDAQ
jgi:hypothetical protein